MEFDDPHAKTNRVQRILRASQGSKEWQQKGEREIRVDLGRI
ncbi:hypothetical protein EV13_2438 [Prochlorococcus sp. MIT 0702]|nr:hypothetical protein EV13_2438 [Prochlorococcus sp. MIT 0702]KGG29365.1 hypothetical protein EV12_0147 [Prochlorococcus sp. MIT 0701]